METKVTILETEKTKLDEEWTNIQRIQREDGNRAMEGTEVMGTETELEGSKAERGP